MVLPMLDNISHARILSASRPGATRSRSLETGARGVRAFLLSFLKNRPPALGLFVANRKRAPFWMESCKQWKLEFEIPWKEQRYEL